MTAPEIVVSRCPSCAARYLPRDGPCPKCGATAAEPCPLPARGTVLAATELASPVAGWTAPHPLVLVEMAQSVRVLCVGSRPAPAPGTEVEVARDGDGYRCSAVGAAGPGVRREGEFPAVGAAGRPFEPPR